MFKLNRYIVLITAFFLINANAQIVISDKKELIKVFNSLSRKYSPEVNSSFFSFMKKETKYSCSCLLNGVNQNSDQTVFFEKLDSMKYIIGFSYGGRYNYDTLFYKGGQILENDSILFNLKSKYPIKYRIKTNLFGLHGIEFVKKICNKVDCMFIYHFKIISSGYASIFRIGISPKIGIVFYNYTDGLYNYKCIMN